MSGMIAMGDAACPCGRSDPRGRPQAYVACCGRYLEDGLEAAAPDAESLMRSRYTAYVRQRANYLLATWHPAHRPVTLDFEPGARWLGLQVRAHRVTGPDTAEVEFVARQRVGGRGVRLHERSRFVRETVQGVLCWLYVNGDILESK
jgi:SEC-C motif-containing protein